MGRDLKKFGNHCSRVFSVFCFKARFVFNIFFFNLGHSSVYFRWLVKKDDVFKHII